MNWYKKAQNKRNITMEEINHLYPVANHKSGELIVRKEIPNIESISASFNDWKEIPEIRNIPLSEFHLTGKSYNIKDTEWIDQLSKLIDRRKDIAPLIVVMDKQGLYILEGGHRAEALYKLNAQILPALIVIDTEEVELI